MLELAIIYIGVALASAFAVAKTVDAYKHTTYTDVEKYQACVKAADNVRECRELL